MIDNDYNPRLLIAKNIDYCFLQLHLSAEKLSSEHHLRTVQTENDTEMRYESCPKVASPNLFKLYSMAFQTHKNGELLPILATPRLVSFLCLRQETLAKAENEISCTQVIGFHLCCIWLDSG